MKQLYTVLILLAPFLVGAQNSDIEKFLWDILGGPFDQEFLDEEYMTVDFDARNGYASISGGGPPCDCDSTTIIAAFKDANGEFTSLENYEASCSWTNYTRSNRGLENILPLGLDINTFIKNTDDIDLSYPIFYLFMEIPRYGTDVKAHIKLVPFGIRYRGDSLLCYEYSEREWDDETEDTIRYGWDRSTMGTLARQIQDQQTYDHILTGDYNKITGSDKEYLLKHFSDKKGNIQFKKKEELIRDYHELQEIYKAYQKLEVMELVLSWDRNNARFIIKQQNGKPKDITFLEFLKEVEFHGIRC